MGNGNVSVSFGGLVCSGVGVGDQVAWIRGVLDVFRESYSDLEAARVVGSDARGSGRGSSVDSAGFFRLSGDGVECRGGCGSALVEDAVATVSTLFGKDGESSGGGSVSRSRSDAECVELNGGSVPVGSLGLVKAVGVMDTGEIGAADVSIGKGVDGAVADEKKMNNRIHRPKGVGLNWERNVESRKKKKENKKKKNAILNSIVGKDIFPASAVVVDDHCAPKPFRPAPEWRRGAGGSEPGSVKKGFSFCDLADRERLELQRSRADMLKAQNELAMMRAQRQVKVLQGNDVDLEVQKYRTKLSSDVEKNMVSIEQTHAYLAKTGNVPGAGSAVPSFVGGTVETVLSGTISPNSSVSEAEVRKMQKDLLDKDAQLEKVSVFLERTMGVNMKYMDLYEKEEWTDTPENMDILAEMFPEGNFVTMPLSYDDKRFTVRRFGC